MFKYFRATVPVVILATAGMAQAAQLSTDARTAIPHDVQQLMVIDYRAMQNSTVGTDMRSRITPASLREFEEALTKSGLDADHDVDQLAFALLSTGSGTDHPMTIGIAQGQFAMQDILANFKKQRIKPAMVRTNKLFPLPKTGMTVCFVDSSTMLFGSYEAVKNAVDARDGVEPNLLSNENMIDAMNSVDTQAVWSILDAKGTKDVVKQMMGEASSIADFDTVKKRLLASSYSMDFKHGVRFEMSLTTGDSFTATTLATLLTAAVEVRKMSASDAEKQALSATSIDADAGGKMSLHFASSDEEFASLLKSPLFQSVTQ
jgi:hypothetical protein